MTGTWLKSWLHWGMKSPGKQKHLHSRSRKSLVTVQRMRSRKRQQRRSLKRNRRRRQNSRVKRQKHLHSRQQPPQQRGEETESRWQAVFSVDEVKTRLASLGYEVKESDELALTFCVEKVRSTVKNEVNWQDVPEGLEHIAIDMAVGEFLLSKKTFMPDDLNGLDLDYAVKQIQTGDTNTVFATGEGSLTPEQRLTAFINYLLSYGKGEFNSFRRIRW